jgi:hypothetical protein
VELLCIGFLELFCFLSGRIPYGLYEEETERNTHIIKEPIRDFLMRRRIDMRIESLLEFEEKTVQEYFSEIQQNMRDDIYSCSQLRIIDDVVGIIMDKGVFKYTYNGLVKPISKAVAKAATRLPEDRIGRVYSVSLNSPTRMAEHQRLVKSMSPRHLKGAMPSPKKIAKWIEETRRRKARSSGKKGGRLSKTRKSIR